MCVCFIVHPIQWVSYVHCEETSGRDLRSSPVYRRTSAKVESLVSSSTTLNRRLVQSRHKNRKTEEVREWSPRTGSFVDSGVEFLLCVGGVGGGGGRGLGLLVV